MITAMKKMNKILCLFLAFVLLLPCLISCTPINEEEEEAKSTQDITASNSSEGPVFTVLDPVTKQTYSDPIEPDEPEETDAPETEPAPVETEPEETKAPETNEPEKAPDGKVTEPTYINGILIANKTYALPSDYNPGVNPEAYSALQKMFSAAKSEGIYLYVISDFRTYDYQAGLYQRYVNKSGKAEADRYSARAGHSEHQTGLAFDLNSLEQTFGLTPEGIWLKENCHEYGFIIRYPEDKESVTGYMYEPWHVRYLGIDTATSVAQSGLCLEEYLNITSVYSN